MSIAVTVLCWLAGIWIVANVLVVIGVVLAWACMDDEHERGRL